MPVHKARKLTHHGVIPLTDDIIPKPAEAVVERGSNTPSPRPIPAPKATMFGGPGKPTPIKPQRLQVVRTMAPPPPSGGTMLSSGQEHHAPAVSPKRTMFGVGAQAPAPPPSPPKRSNHPPPSPKGKGRTIMISQGSVPVTKSAPSAPRRNPPPPPRRQATMKPVELGNSQFVSLDELETAQTVHDSQPPASSIRGKSEDKKPASSSPKSASYMTNDQLAVFHPLMAQIAEGGDADIRLFYHKDMTNDLRTEVIKHCLSAMGQNRLQRFFANLTPEWRQKAMELYNQREEQKGGAMAALLPSTPIPTPGQKTPPPPAPKRATVAKKPEPPTVAPTQVSEGENEGSAPLGLNSEPIAEEIEAGFRQEQAPVSIASLELADRAEKSIHNKNGSPKDRALEQAAKAAAQSSAPPPPTPAGKALPPPPLSRRPAAPPQAPRRLGKPASKPGHVLTPKPPRPALSSVVSSAPSHPIPPTPRSGQVIDPDPEGLEETHLFVPQRERQGSIRPEASNAGIGSHRAPMPSQIGNGSSRPPAPSSAGSHRPPQRSGSVSGPASIPEALASQRPSASGSDQTRLVTPAAHEEAAATLAAAKILSLETLRSKIEEWQEKRDSAPNSAVRSIYQEALDIVTKRMASDHPPQPESVFPKPTGNTRPPHDSTPRSPTLSELARQANVPVAQSATRKAVTALAWIAGAGILAATAFAIAFFIAQTKQASPQVPTKAMITAD